MDENEHRNLWLQAMKVIVDIESILKDFREPNRPSDEECKKLIKDEISNQ